VARFNVRCALIGLSKAFWGLRSNEQAECQEAFDRESYS
jgi:hypothetical protein